MKVLKFAVILFVAAQLRGDQWVQSSKSEFQTGTLSGVQATKPSADNDGYLRLATTIFNGYFDETDDALDGWTDESTGDGTHTVEVVDGGGRTSVAHLYASYGTQETFARISQTFSEGLDFLKRFNFELYPIGSETSSGGERIVMHVFAYDSQGNSIITGGWFTYLLQGEYTPREHDWRSQTEFDRWNIYRFDLKSDIEENLSVGYSWSDVASVKILFSIEALSSGRECGAYIDAVWAAPFIDDNFDDNSVNTSKWTVYDSLYNVDEQNQYVRFWGYDDNSQSQNWASFDRDHEIVGTSSCEAAAMVRHEYMEQEEGQEFELGFYSPTSGKYLILRAHRTADTDNGFYYVSYYDGSNWNSSQIGTYNFLNMSDFHEWRIIYDADNDRFEAWVEGKMVGRVESFVMENYYPYFAATNDAIDPTDSIDCQLDDFMFFDYNDGSWDTRYVLSGECISAPYNLGFPADFLKLKWVASTPSGTEVKFQFRSAWTQSELENADWRGPDGPGTYFTVSGQEFDGFHDGHKWFQVKAILSSTDSLVTPTLDSITVEFDSMAVVEGDSGQVELGNGVSKVVHYDGAGKRASVVYFTGLSKSPSPVFTAAVHGEPHPRLDGGINKWWRVDINSPFTSADLVLFYEDSDIPPDIDEGTMVFWRYDGEWNSFGPNILNTSDNFARKNELTELSEWTLGKPGALGVVEWPSDPPGPSPTVSVLVDGAAVGVKLELLKTSDCYIKMFDVSGRLIGSTSRRLTQGVHILRLRAPHKGVILLKIEVDGRVFTEKALIIR